MKKLMTVLASAATALFAIGVAKGDDFTTQGTGFEDYSEGAVFDAQKDDAGGTSGDKYWYSTASAGEIGDISNHVGTVAAALVPDYFENAGIGNRYLHIDTSAPLFRTAVANIQGAESQEDFFSPTNNFVTPVDIGDGIYLDTLVQFTAADDEFQDGSLQDGDKIAISYVEHEDDATTEGVNEGWTNFVIRAGYIGTSEITQKNYKAKLPGAAVFNKDDWHRLTVRTVPNIDGNGNVGFVVYVDQVALVYAVDNETIGTDVELAGVAATVPTSVFPSAVAAGGTGGSTISAASFSGTGAIDDVVITKDMPNFIKENSLVRIAITLGTGVNGVTVTTNSVAVDADATSTEAMKVFLLAPETASFGLTGIYETGYSNLTAVFADGDTTSSFDDGTVTFEGASLAFTVKASRNNFNVFKANGDPISGTYETLSQALAATGVAKIQLAYDYVVPAEEIPENAPVFEIGENDAIVLDLNGKTLNGGGSDNDEMFYIEGVLTVIDSSSANTGKIIYTGEAGVFAADSNAELYIGAAEGDYGPKIDGLLFVANYEGLVVNAKVLASANTAEDAVVWADFVARGSTLKAAQVDGYWVVAPSDTPQPTTYTVTFSDGEGYTVTDITNVTDGKAAAGATVTFKVTVDDGYDASTLVVKNGETVLEADEGVYSVTVNAAVEIMITVEEEQSAKLTLTITPNVNADATVTINGELAETGAEIKADDEIVVTATPKENFEYAQTPAGWVAGQAGAITKTITVVDASVTVEIPAPTAKQQGGYPTYIEEIEDATVKAAYEAKYDTWKGTYGADAESAFGTAFLLNIAPNAADQTLEPASITIADGKVVITANKDLGAVNGKVYVKTAATLAGLKTAEWAAATLDETTKAINVTQGSTDTAGFYQIKVDF